MSMKRTKASPREITTAQKIALTAENIAKYIPGCEVLEKLVPTSYDDWNYDWYNGIYENVDWQDHNVLNEKEEYYTEDTILEILEDPEEVNIQMLACCVKYKFDSWLEFADEEVIMEVLHPLRVPEKRSVLQSLKYVADAEYHPYFDNNKYLNGIPASLVRPLIPFFPFDRTARLIYLDKEFSKRTGNTTMTMRGAPLQGRDIRTTFALSQIMKRKPIKYIRNMAVMFTTSYEEIGKELGIKNPCQISAREAILKSLERMRSCVIRWTDQKGLRTIGGILVKAREIEMDSRGLIEIYFDNDFIKMFDHGYIDINPKALFKMSDKEIAVYLFLSVQQNFMKTGRYGEPRKGIDLFKTYDYMNLQGLGAKPKPKFTIRSEMKQLMEACKETGIFKNYRITKKDKLVIRGKGQVFDK